MLPNQDVSITKEQLEENQKLFDQFQKVESEWPALEKKYKGWIDERNAKRGMIDRQTKPAELRLFKIERQETAARLEASTAGLRLAIIGEIRSDLQPEKMYKLHKAEFIRIENVEFTRKVLIPHEPHKIDYDNKKIRELMKDSPQWDAFCKRVEKENEPRYAEQDCLTQTYLISTNRRTLNSVKEILLGFSQWLLNEAKRLPIQRILDEKEKVFSQILKVDLSKMEEIEMTKDDWQMYEAYIRGSF